MVSRIALCVAAVTLALILAALPGPPKESAAATIVFATAVPVAVRSPFGASCAQDADCESGACSKGRQGAFCSTRCTRDTDCPAPPGVGSCNGRGFCKKSEDKGKGKS